MKKEFLLGLGIAEDLAKQVMEENGKDIEREKGKLSPILSERDALQARIDDVEGKLKAFEGVDVKDLQGKITALTGELDAQKQTHTAELLKRDRESETATFLASKRFVNTATRDYYGMKLNAALEDAANNGKNREDLLKALTVGEDGQPLQNIFEADNTARPRVPPTGRVTPEDVSKLSGGMGSLQETIANINAHRITGK